MIVVLPAPFGPSNANTVPGSTIQLDAVEDEVLTERLAQAGDGDSRRG